jgi:hypothetical protein
MSRLIEVIAEHARRAIWEKGRRLQIRALLAGIRREERR